MLPAKTLLLGFSDTTQLLYLLPQLLELCYLLWGSLLECIYFMMGMQSIIFGKYDIQLRQCVRGFGLVYCFINKEAKVQESLYLCMAIQLYLKMGKMCRSSTLFYLHDLSFCLLILPKCILYFQEFLFWTRFKTFPVLLFTYIHGWFYSKTLSLSSVYRGIAPISWSCGVIHCLGALQLGHQALLGASCTVHYS